jgi:hypothetical protein
MHRRDAGPALAIAWIGLLGDSDWRRADLLLTGVPMPKLNDRERLAKIEADQRKLAE